MAGLTSRARQLRRHQTGAEKTRWSHLANRRLEGSKFILQQPIGRYIVDLVSFEHRLVVELDGGSHNQETARNRDDARTAWLEGNGYRVLRFWNNEVQSNLNGVLETILKVLKDG